MAPPGKTVSVKGQKIREFADQLVDMAESQLTPIQNQLKNVNVGFPAFGVIGLPFLAGHYVLRNQADSNVGDAVTTIQLWRQAMRQTADTWDRAEQDSTANN
jgi:hypothetical protein